MKNRYCTLRRCIKESSDSYFKPEINKIYLTYPCSKSWDQDKCRVFTGKSLTNVELDHFEELTEEEIENFLLEKEQLSFDTMHEKLFTVCTNNGNYGGMHDNYVIARDSELALLEINSDFNGDDVSVREFSLSSLYIINGNKYKDTHELVLREK